MSSSLVHMFFFVFNFFVRVCEVLDRVRNPLVFIIVVATDRLGKRTVEIRWEISVPGHAVYFSSCLPILHICEVTKGLEIVNFTLRLSLNEIY